MPARRAVKTLQPSSAPSVQSARFLAPSSPSTLRPVYEKALALRAKELGVQDPKVARSASDLGLFLAQTGDAAGAEAPLRKALAIDQANRAPELAADRENLAGILEKLGKGAEASQLYQQAAAGSDAKGGGSILCQSGAAGSAASRRALTQRHRRDDSRLWKRRPARRGVAPPTGASASRTRDDGAAEPLLRRALTIQETAASPDQTFDCRDSQYARQSDRGSAPVRSGRSSDEKSSPLGGESIRPESVELSATCTNLADVLWNKHDLAGAELLYGRALAADSALYGANRPEAAADMANLGMLLKRPDGSGKQKPGCGRRWRSSKSPWARQSTSELVRQGLAK